jgi:1-acyl-sn-glycerol-3-phosphate acyltransferase
LNRYLKPFTDVAITLLVWSYFTIGFVLFFAPFYLWAYRFSGNREISFQRLNHRFYQGFFALVRTLIPSNRWRVADDVRSIRSAVIVCNHISYLDPLLLISLFEKHKTIVKSRLFDIPIFGWMLKLSGYIPSDSSGKLADLMVERIEGMSDYLAAGGNLFVFPEGTRSRSGSIGALNRGAFKIARRCRRPINVLYIRNTDKLLQPGKFLFNCGEQNTISVELLGSIEPADGSERFQISDVMTQVHALLEARAAEQVS